MVIKRLFLALTTIALAVAVTGVSTAQAKSYPTAPFSVDVKRPAMVYPPALYRGAAPILISLHGYTSSGAGQEAYINFRSEASKRGVLYVTPNGTKDGGGQQFWNAGKACCNFYGSTVDDVSYLMGLIDEVNKRYPVDRKRVYFVGHSNGGFMTYRLACEQSRKITAIVSFAGSMDVSRPKCAAAIPISILHIHGTADTTISPDGATLTSNSAPFASVLSNLQFWSAKDKCGLGDSLPKASSTLDLSPALPGAETSVYSFTCSTRTSLQYWSIAGGEHVPSLNSNFAPRIFDFLLAQKRP